MDFHMTGEPNPAQHPSPLVCVIVQGWPRITTTFVAQELVGLEEAGLRLWLATYGPTDKIRHALHDRLKAPIHKLGDPFRQPARLIRAWLKVRKLPGYDKARALFSEELAHGTTRRRLRAFARAILLAGEMPPDVGLIYSQFIHSATSIGRYASAMTGLPLVASAHARDIWTAPEWDKRAKLDSMEWCTTCTASGADHLAQLAGKPGKVKLIHHGLLLDRFPDDMPRHSARDGSDANDPVLILSVGRAVEKKGFDVLLDALAKLPKELNWRWNHIGEGALLGRLKDTAVKLGIADRIEWNGAKDQSVVIESYRNNDLFVLPCREASDQDRDGLPNVLMEAQSQGLACLSTSFSGIPELIEDDVNGVLVPPGDSDALAIALTDLISRPDRRARLGEAGFHKVRSQFRAETGIEQVARMMRDAAVATA
jgi:glycosyltransferase involved in cell wall biosynthesis